MKSFSVNNVLKFIKYATAIILVVTTIFHVNVTMLLSVL